MAWGSILNKEKAIQDESFDKQRRALLARLSAWAVAVSMLPLAGTPWEQQALARNDKTYYKQEGSDPIFVAGVRFE